MSEALDAFGSLSRIMAEAGVADEPVILKRFTLSDADAIMREHYEAPIAMEEERVEKAFTGLRALIADGIEVIPLDARTQWMSTTDEAPLTLTADDWKQILAEARREVSARQAAHYWANRKLTDEPVT
jgi:hypothetical protein